MAKKCHMDVSLLVDYLDHNLKDEERMAVETHLKECRSCQEKIKMQEKWLSLIEESGLSENPDAVADEQTLLRIKQQIQEAMSSDLSESKNQKGEIRRRSYWLQAASFAAAILLVIWILPALFTRWQEQKGSQSAGNEIADQEKSSVTSQAGLTQEILNEQTTVLYAWSVYKGSLADIDAMSCFFETNRKSETMPANESDESVNETKSQDMTASNYFLSSNRQLNTTGQIFLDVLNEAEKLRIITNVKDKSQAIILAAYDPENAEKNEKQLRSALKTCQNPIKIEIIRSVELLSRLESVEPGLFGRVFCEPIDDDLTWILILIGA